MTEHDVITAFEELGLTRVEAEVYVYLVQNPPATGYAIAAAINRTKGAIYKVLVSLAEKGAVLIDEGRSSLARAVPPPEFLAHLEDRFNQRKHVAGDAAKHLRSSPEDQRIYQLTNTYQVYERARQMLTAARERILLEISPAPLRVLRGTLENAAAQDLEITARVYAPTEIKGVRIISSPYGEDLAAHWNAQWLAVFVDGLQYLFAQFSEDGTHIVQAVWSQSPFLSSAIFGYVNSDLHHYAFRSILQECSSADEIRAEYNRLQKDFPVGGDLGWKQQLQKS